MKSTDNITRISRRQNLERKRKPGCHRPSLKHTKLETEMKEIGQTWKNKGTAEELVLAQCVTERNKD